MTAAAIPLATDALPLAGPAEAAEPEVAGRDFREHLADAEEPCEAEQEPTEPEALGRPELAAAVSEELSEELPKDEDAPEPLVVPFVLAEPLAVEVDPVTADTQAMAVEATTEHLETGGALPQPEPAGPELFDVEELPAPTGEAPLEAATAAGDSDLTDLGADTSDTDSTADSMLTDAAQAFDVETAELDGLLEPEAIAEAPPEIQDTPELPVHDNGKLRVAIDDDLSVEVSKRGGRINVAVDGSAAAMREVQDLGPELAASLRELGLDLGGFTQQDREGSAGDGDQSGGARGDSVAETPRKASGGRLVNRLA
jgi:hypothetical protein